MAVCANGAVLWDVHTESVAVKLMLRHDRLSADALLTRAKAVGGHLAEFSHSSTNDTLLEIIRMNDRGASAAGQLTVRLTSGW
jgi:hypothetical protein